jgi:hypothetical protein
MINSLLQSFSDSPVTTKVQPIDAATVIETLPQDCSHLNLSEPELHSPAMNAAVFSTQKGSVSAIEFGEQLILFRITGQEKSVVLDIDTPLERVKHLILSYI